MKKIVAYLFAAILILEFACTKVPITGRRQVNMLPESVLTNMSLTNYKQFLTQNKPEAAGNTDVVMVRKVGQKLVDAITRYLKAHKQSKRIKNFKWEFNVVNDKTINAWCMPGGKVVVYTGLLPVTKDETGLAVVMGHEIAHAIARHGNERMSQQIAAQLGGIGLAVAMSQKPQEVQNIFNQAYGAGSSLGMLKYSRVHESEADKMGVIFMAMAGYNPQESVTFWERMKTATGGANVPQFLSTHPSDETRIKDLKAFMPQAMKYYKKPV